MSRYPVDTAPACPVALPGCSGRIRERGAKMCASCWRAQSAKPALPDVTPEQSVEADRQKLKLSGDVLTCRRKYDEALRVIEKQQSLLDAAGVVDSRIDTFTIDQSTGGGGSEATAILVASDWHLEERVGAEVGSLNRYDLGIAHERVSRFWQSAHRLVRMFNNDVDIRTVVVALLGDFITGAIHGEENAELNELQPVQAILEAQKLIASGFEFLLANTTYNFKVVCHSGNHARTTKTTRFSAENGHSLEYFMYQSLANHFRNEPRMEFIIPDAPISYVQVYDTSIRFMHGHQIKYGGGVGGLTIPAIKKIAKWDEGRRADLTVFGHFHQLFDGGRFLVNGSVIGYNGFALAIGAAYEPPQQMLFLVNSKYGRQGYWPIKVG